PRSLPNSSRIASITGFGASSVRDHAANVKSSGEPSVVASPAADGVSSDALGAHAARLVAPAPSPSSCNRCRRLSAALGCADTFPPGDGGWWDGKFVITP